MRHSDNRRDAGANGRSKGLFAHGELASRWAALPIVLIWGLAGVMQAAPAAASQALTRPTVAGLPLSESPADIGVTSQPGSVLAGWADSGCGAA